MSADTKTKKRKSSDAVVPTAKKVKMVKSAEKAAPLKSALKKSKVETVVEQPKSKKTKASTKASKKPVPQEIEESDDDEAGAELSADRTAELLAGFSSSEDEDAENIDEDGIEISKLPNAPIVNSNKEVTNTDPESTPGVVYISRIPRGFFEPQMRAYFTQFGTVTHLRLARNKSTGKSQHYAFVEFASSSVADIVAKTMDKYLLFGHILQCRRVPEEQVKEGMWDKKGRVRKGGRGKVRNRVEGARLRKGVGRHEWEGRVEREERRRIEKGEKMREMGYEFEMPPVKRVKDVPAKEIDTVAGADEDEDGVKLLEGRKLEVASGIAEKIEVVVAAAAGSSKGTEEKTIKRKIKASGATTTTKKRKIKVTA